MARKMIFLISLLALMLSLESRAVLSDNLRSFLTENPHGQMVARTLGGIQRLEGGDRTAVLALCKKIIECSARLENMCKTHTQRNGLLILRVAFEEAAELEMSLGSATGILGCALLRVYGENITSGLGEGLLVFWDDDLAEQSLDYLALTDWEDAKLAQGVAQLQEAQTYFDRTLERIHHADIQDCWHCQITKFLIHTQKCIFALHAEQQGRSAPAQA